MSKRFVKLLAVVVCITSVFSNASVVFAQEGGGYSVSTYCVEQVENPVYYGENAGESINVDFEVSPESTNTYFSNDIDDSLYTTSMENAAQSIRDNMELRTSKFTLYYKFTSSAMTETVLDNLITELFEKALEETDNPTEGDYLRYAWTSLIYGDEQQNSVSVSYIDNGSSRDYYIDIVYNFTYYTTLEQEQELTSEVEKVIDGFGFNGATTERQKVDKIYNYITTNICYDYANLNDESYKLKFTAYAALMNKTAVCEGYTVLFYRMAEMCGIDSRVITGWGDSYTHPSDENDLPDHAWNIAKIGDYYYYLDSTWDESVTDGVPAKTDYYLKGGKDFFNHTNEEKFETEAFKTSYPISEYCIDRTDNSGTVIEGDFTYQVVDGIAALTKYNGTAAHVIVPAQTSGGYPVKVIDSDAFYEVENMQTLTVSEGITTLNWGSVYLCRALTTINLPSTLKVDYEHLETGAFSGATQLPEFCYNLETINVAENNPYIKVVDGVLYTADMKVLLQCPAMKETPIFTIPDGVETITNHAFEDCEKIEKVVMPDTVNFIGYWAFSKARELKEINISTSCEFIGQFFISATKVSEIHIPKSVNRILSGPFGDIVLEKITADEGGTYYVENSALRTETQIIKVITDETSYTVAEGIEYIDSYAFSNLENLEKVTLPDSLTYLSSNVFENCKKLTHVTIPENTKRIGSYAFIGCDMLASVIIPSSVTEIGDVTQGDRIFYMLAHPNQNFTIYCDEGSYIYNKAIECGVSQQRLKPIDEFICQDGHDFEQTYDEDLLNYTFTCEQCGDKSGTVYPHNIWHAEVEIEYFNTEYTGEAITPKIERVTFGETTLTEGVDYVIWGYENNVEIGTAYVILRGIGEWGGIKKVLFSITQIHIHNIEFELEYETVSYDGTAKTPKVTAPGLTENVDFTVEYGSNIWPGQTDVRITGIGKYWGYKTLYFTIEQQDISGRTFELSYESAAYTPAGHYPDVTLEGLNFLDDYTVSYQNNIEVGTATVTVTGVGFYKGTIQKTFEITRADISGYEFYLLSDFFSYNGNPIEPELYWLSGDNIELGRDYTVTYTNNVNQGTATITVQGIGNYKGTIIKNFDVTQANIENLRDTLEIGACNICGNNRCVYSGEQHKPSVTIPGLTEGVDFVVSYGPNVNAGQGWVQVEGIGNYGGAITTLIEIDCREISTLPITLEYTKTTYNGDTKLPAVIIDGFTEYSDYMVTYWGDVISVGTVTVEITGIGNLTGVTTKTYVIDKAKQTAPAKPTLSGKTTTTVTLKAVSGYEYSKNGTAWQSSNKFTGLKANTTYKFYQRKKATANQYASPASVALSVKTNCSHKYSSSCDTSCDICKATRNITHTYKTKTTKATLSKNGSIVKKCAVCGKVASNTAIKYVKSFKLSTTTYTYNGGVKTPSVTVKDSAGKTLKKNTDYTVTYASGRKNVGTYKVTVKMVGKYTGTKTLTFKIHPTKTTVSKLTAGKKSITVAITKKSTQVTGYQIQYGVSKTFSKATTKTISSYKTTKYTLKSLSAKKTYYVRVRTHKKVGSTTYYSGWSTYKYTKAK